MNSHLRYVLDFVLAYTGIKNLTLALNVDYGHEQDEPFIRSLGTRQDTRRDVVGLGRVRGVRLDREASGRRCGRSSSGTRQGARTGSGSGDGALVHDRDDPVQDLEGARRAGWSIGTTSPTSRCSGCATRRPDRSTSQGLLARGKSMDTISLSLYYSFF